MLFTDRSALPQKWLSHSLALGHALEQSILGLGLLQSLSLYDADGDVHIISFLCSPTLDSVFCFVLLPSLSRIHYCLYQWFCCQNWTCFIMIGFIVIKREEENLYSNYWHIKFFLQYCGLFLCYICFMSVYYCTSVVNNMSSGSGHLSVVCPSVRLVCLSRFVWRDIALLRRWISMKLIINIHHMNRN